MAGDGDDPADIHALMEALWGPRSDSGAGPSAGQAADEPVAATAPAAEARTAPSDPVDVSDLRQELNVLRAELAAVELRLSLAVDGAVSPADHSQLRADLELQMVEQLRLVLQEALAAVDARAAAMGAELNARLDGSVTKEDFAALRSELKQALSANMASAQAALQQRVAVMDATLADVKAQVGVRLGQLAALVATEAAAAAERATLDALPWRSPGT